MNVIEPAQTVRASRVLFAPKKDGNLSSYVDYRRLNAASGLDSYPLPRINEDVESLGEEKVFSTLDGNSCYRQIKVDLSEREKTTFTSSHGL